MLIFSLRLDASIVEPKKNLTLKLKTVQAFINKQSRINLNPTVYSQFKSSDANVTLVLRLI